MPSSTGLGQAAKLSLATSLSAVTASIFNRSQRRAVRDICDLLRTRFPLVTTGPATSAFLSPLGCPSDDRVGLAKAIFGSELRRLSRAEPYRVIEFLGSAVAQDFEDGRVLVMDGWCLSQTEARLLALVATPDAP